MAANMLGCSSAPSWQSLKACRVRRITYLKPGVISKPSLFPLLKQMASGRTRMCIVRVCGGGGGGGGGFAQFTHLGALQCSHAARFHDGAGLQGGRRSGRVCRRWRLGRCRLCRCCCAPCCKAQAEALASLVYLQNNHLQHLQRIPDRLDSASAWGESVRVLGWRSCSPSHQTPSAQECRWTPFFPPPRRSSTRRQSHVL